MPARFTLEFSSKEIAFFAAAAAAAFVVVFLVRLHVKVAATGWVGVSLCVCVSVHSAVEHCSVRWWLPKGWGERSRKRTQLKVTF